MFRPRPKVDVYQRALELAGHVHRVLEHATNARFHLKDRLDRYTAQMVVELGRAAADIQTARWRYYRSVSKLATDCAAILDLFDHQDVTTAQDDLDRAQATVRRLLNELEPLRG